MRIRVLGLPDPDPKEPGTDPDPSIYFLALKNSYPDLDRDKDQSMLAEEKIIFSSIFRTFYLVFRQERFPLLKGYLIDFIGANGLLGSVGGRGPWTLLGPKMARAREKIISKNVAVR